MAVAKPLPALPRLVAQVVVGLRLESSGTAAARVAAWLLLLVWVAAWSSLLSFHGAEAGAGSPIRLASDPLRHWVIMVAAMMAPLLLAPTRSLLERSRKQSWVRDLAGFASGYLLPWLALGLLTIVALDLCGIVLNDTWILAVSFAGAAAWAVSPPRAVALARCRLNPPTVRPGLLGLGDSFGFGWNVGCGCVVVCAPAMIACTAAAHSPIAVALLSLVSFPERFSSSSLPRLTAFAVLGVGAVSLYVSTKSLMVH